MEFDGIGLCVIRVHFWIIPDLVVIWPLTFRLRETPITHQTVTKWPQKKSFCQGCGVGVAVPWSPGFDPAPWLYIELSMLVHGFGYFLPMVTISASDVLNSSQPIYLGVLLRIHCTQPYL